jgi:hypothetical protein
VRVVHEHGDDGTESVDREERATQREVTQSVEASSDAQDGEGSELIVATHHATVDSEGLKRGRCRIQRVEHRREAS